jgi:carboxyl-terminal processing protease
LDGETVLETYLTSLGHAYDPHTDYLSPSDLENFSISMKLSLVGIGAVLSSEDGYAKIMSIVPGGPADLDKRLKVNDRVAAVAQGDAPWVDVVDMRLQKVVDQIRGKKGTEVRLLVIPADATDTSTRVEIKLVRDEIKLTEQEAKAKVIEINDVQDRTRKLGYIDLPSFYGDLQQSPTSKSTTRDVRQLIEHLRTQEIEGLVIDLRRNGGGALSEAIALTGLFIREGPVVQVRDTAGNIQMGRDTDASVAYDGPMVVLTSHTSASASEIFAGALQDYGRAVIVGEKSTFGKGTVQSMLEVGRFVPPRNGKQPEWGALKLTIQKFYRVSGGSTQNRGVIPDIQVPSTLDYRKVSETALKNAMPYDEVPTAKYEGVNQVTPYIVTLLRRLSESRVRQAEEFAYIRDDIERLKAQLEENSVSLNESKRLAEKAADAARAEERKKAREARARESAFKVVEVTLENLNGNATPTVAFNKTVMQAATQVDGAEPPPPPDPDPVFEEGLHTLTDLVRLSAVAAR